VSELGEISAELNQALDRLERLLASLAELDRGSLAPLQAELSSRPDGRHAAALIVRARQLLRQAADAVVAARGAGREWLTQHGSSDGGHAPAGFEIKGGRAYLRAEESEHRSAAAALPEFPAEYTFVAHGDPEHVYIGEDPLSAAEAAELIRSDGNWNRSPVRLFSCETGRGAAPFAQELAKILGVRVTAPDGIAWAAADGSYGIHPIEVKIVRGEVVEVRNEEVEGSWREFYPD
jgi:hypothetical protein